VVGPDGTVEPRRRLAEMMGANGITDAEVNGKEKS